MSLKYFQAKYSVDDVSCRAGVRFLLSDVMGTFCQVVEEHVVARAEPGQASYNPRRHLLLTHLHFHFT